MIVGAIVMAAPKKLGGPFLGCPCHESPVVLTLY